MKRIFYRIVMIDDVEQEALTVIIAIFTFVLNISMIIQRRINDFNLQTLKE